MTGSTVVYSRQHEAGGGLPSLWLEQDYRPDLHEEVTEYLSAIVGETMATVAPGEVRGQTIPEAFNVDSDPELRAFREAKRAEAAAIRESFMEKLREGDEFNEVPMDGDMFTTARKLKRIKEEFGEDSPEYQAGWQGHQRNSDRRVAEASRMNGWELYDVTELDWDPQSEHFFSDGYDVDEMLANGLTPTVSSSIDEEPDRRDNEFVEIKTDGELIKRPDMEGRSAYKISQCPKSVIDAYRRDPKKRVVSDYVPAIEKQMIRHKRFSPKENKIYLQQMALPGTYINNEVNNILVARMNAIDGNGKLDRTEVHGLDIITDDGEIRDVVDMVRLADQVASEYHGIPIYLGMPLEPGQVPRYDTIHAEAARRRKEQADLSHRYAKFVHTLANSDDMDPSVAARMADEYLRDELLKIAEKDPSKARIMFDGKTADRFARANQLEGSGRTQEAQALRDEARELAPAAGGCGASCDLSNPSGSEKKEAQDLLGTKSEKMLKDDKRPCAKCGKRKVVVYADWTETNKGKKGCLACKSTEGVSSHQGKPGGSLTFTIFSPTRGGSVTLTRSKENSKPKQANLTA